MQSAGVGRIFLRALCVVCLVFSLAPNGAAAIQHPEVDLLEDVVDSDMRNRHPEWENHGTGFHIDDRGHVLTAAHIVAGCRNIMASFENATAGRARLLGLDARRDVALLSVDEQSEMWFDLSRDPPVSDRLAVFAGAGNDRVAWRFIIARLGPQFRSGPFELSSFSPALERGASGSPVLDGRGFVIGMSVGTITEAAGLSLAVGGKDLRTFLSYMGVAPPRVRPSPPGPTDQRVSRTRIALLRTGIVRIDCA
jgi:S1-C subfamily serine protease